MTRIFTMIIGTPIYYLLSAMFILLFIIALICYPVQKIMKRKNTMLSDNFYDAVPLVKAIFVFSIGSLVILNFI